jgi:hypothetical protein
MCVRALCSIQMGLAGQMVHGIAECGPSFRRRLAAGGLLPALCSAASADLATGAGDRACPRPSRCTDAHTHVEPVELTDSM